MLTENDSRLLMQACHPDPFSVLGMHQTGADVRVAVLLPQAARVDLLDARTLDTVATLKREDGTDLFCALVPGSQSFDYRLRVQWNPTREVVAIDGQVIDDPYRFGPQLQELDVWLLSEGTHQRPYECLGAHLMTVDGSAGVRFAVWAPNAQRV